MKQFSENDNTNGSTGAFLTGVFAGAVVGAGLALWFAPKSGVEMREQLTDSARDMGQRVSKGVSDLGERGREMFDRARDVAATAGDQIDKVAADASKAIDRGRRGAQTVMNAAADSARS